FVRRPHPTSNLGTSPGISIGLERIPKWLNQFSVRPRESGDPDFRAFTMWPWMPAFAGTNGDQSTLSGNALISIRPSRRSNLQPLVHRKRLEFLADGDTAGRTGEQRL